MTAYDRLKARFERMATIGEARSILGWDAAAVMPPGGSQARGDQLAVLSSLSHGLLIAPATADDLAEAELSPPIDVSEARNLALMRHEHTRGTALPSDLVEATARANSACEKVWREARQASDFALVQPYLAEVMALAGETATALGEALNLAPYDALMDGYQRGVLAAGAEPVFADYVHYLEAALPEAERLQALRPAPVPLEGHFAADRQEAFCLQLSRRLGLEEAHSRLDRSTHPFCGGTHTDVRITTRYDETSPETAILGVLHETGHALYERGLPSAHERQPAGEAAGMAVHESQSLIVEMQTCRSDAFLSWLGPQMHAAFGGEAHAYEGANLARLWRKVERGFIRVDADEMTYPAHVILRFKLEKALISGDLKVADIPSAWAEEMQRLLGVTPPDDARGCLQDIHWYDGAVGYFPSYTLGAMAAAQLMAAARDALPGLDAGFAQGELATLTGWLRTHVHQLGSRHGFNELLREATGSALDPRFFKAHLQSRYLTAA